jgi:surfactin synthase thioesterase subunit
MKIILLPGLDGTGALFKPFIDLLPKDIEPVIIQYPLNEQLTYSEICDLVMSQLPEDEEYILVGESFSGPIVYEIAYKKPKNIKSVIFIASFLSNPRPNILKLLRFVPLKLMLFMPIPRFIVKLFVLGGLANDEIMKLFMATIKRIPANQLVFRLNEIAKLTMKEYKCNVKAIYIQASSDKLVPKKSLEEFKDKFKELKIFKVEGSHFVMQVNPSSCLKVIVR